LRLLTEAVDLQDRGMRGPLPMPAATACAYAEVRHGGGDVADALTKAADQWKFSYENTDRDHALVWGEAPGFSLVTAERPWPDEDWYAAEPDRFGQLACRLWFPLLTHETVDIP
jgi:exodeoxyribonuclease V gamma subunit